MGKEIKSSKSLTFIPKCTVIEMVAKQITDLVLFLMIFFNVLFLTNYSFTDKQSRKREHTQTCTREAKKIIEKNTIDSWGIGILGAKNQRGNGSEGQRNKHPRNLHKYHCSLSLNKNMFTCKGNSTRLGKLLLDQC